MIRVQSPVFSTCLVCVLLYAVACATTTNFFSARVGVNFVQDNAFLGIAAVGVTFVILTGGIDLSVGAVIGWTTMATASLVMRHHVHPFVAMPVVLATTTVIGGAIGLLVHFFAIPPFLMTLGALFLYRGWALLISQETLPLSHPAFDPLSDTLFRLPGHVPIRLATFVVLIVFGLTAVATQFTRFGRSLYAIGGSESSALLMGLPVARNKMLVYSASGFFAGLAGLVYMTRSPAGDALAGTGLELDAIAVAVVGGTLLSGGVGGISGTFLGLLIFGIIQAVVNFRSFDSAWTRIAIGAFLLAFILLQKFLRFMGSTATS